METTSNKLEMLSIAEADKFENNVFTQIAIESAHEDHEKLYKGKRGHKKTTAQLAQALGHLQENSVPR